MLTSANGASVSEVDKKMLIQPGPELLREVRVGFIRKGSSLRAWSLENQVHQGYLIQVLRGRTNGPCAQAWRERLITESGITANEGRGHRQNVAAA